MARARKDGEKISFLLTAKSWRICAHMRKKKGRQ